MWDEPEHRQHADPAVSVNRKLPQNTTTKSMRSLPSRSE
jgi:hypothetical protein